MSFLFGGLGGGANTPPPRDLGQELNQIYNIFQQRELPLFHQWMQKEPLLRGAQSLAWAGAQQIPALQSLLSGAYGQIQPRGTYLRPFQTAYGQLPNVSSLQQTIRRAYGGLTPEHQLTAPLLAGLQQVGGVIGRQGALSPEMARLATQQAAARNAAAGMATTTPGLFTEALNREQYRQQRLNDAYQQAQGLSGAVSGLDTAALQRSLSSTAGQLALGTQGFQNALGYSNALRGLDLSNFQTAMGYAQGLQGLEQQPLQNLLGTQQVGTSTLAQLLNPSQSYAQDLFNTNYNAQAAANIANSNKQAGLLGSGISATGNILGGMFQSGMFG